MRLLPILLLAIFGVSVTPAAAQDAIDKAFAETFYAKEQIAESVKERPDVSWLEKSDMNQLLEAKAALTEFFQALRPGNSGNVRSYLAPGLASRYGDRTALRRERFGAENYLSFEIIDYRIEEGQNGIKLRYFLSESDRGKASIRQRAVTLEKISGHWLISEFDNFDFD